MSVLLDEAIKLPVTERIKLVEDIWDSIAPMPDAIGLTPEQIDEIERRIADYQKNPEKLVLWEEARARLRRIA